MIAPLDEVYAGPLVFPDQYLTAREYARIIGRTPRQVRRMARAFVFSDFGIPIVSIPKGRRGPHQCDIYIFFPASMRS